MAREASGSCGARGQQDGGASVRGASKAVACRAARAALGTSGVAAGWRGYMAGSYRPAGGGVQAGEDGDAGQEVRRPLRARGALRLRTPGARGPCGGCETDAVWEARKDLVARGTRWPEAVACVQYLVVQEVWG